MTIRNWISAKEIDGSMTFSFTELKEKFPSMSDQILKNEITRLSKQGIILAVYKGFYTIIPAHYKSRGIVPPTFYVDQLFRYLNRPYYISLLSAAELHGAAHQRPQKSSVTTIMPTINVSNTKNKYLSWFFRKEIDPTLLCEKNSETGTIKFSNPELTAVDLIQYESHIGGLSVASTVLEELLESTDFNRNFTALIKMASFPALQRLGFIIENIIGDPKQAAVLYSNLQKCNRRLNYIPLKSGKSFEGCSRDPKWKIIINQEIELDEI